MEYLDFKTAKCKDCFRCLRECPVKAIRFENHQAKIVDERCILCGRCTMVCPQNAKKVHSELEDVKLLLKNSKVVASVAPSFVSSFGIQDFSVMQMALSKLGFFSADETAVGANAVTAEYSKLLESGSYEKLISSACPAINRMIQVYYPKALKYLAPVASPMVVHARMLKKKYPDAKIVFIGPCIAKKREARESGIIDGVLTFEDLNVLFAERGVEIDKIACIDALGHTVPTNIAKYYPINNGIIKSFKTKTAGYEYVAVDGVKRSFEMLADIDSLSGMFIEINCCEYACIKGPCSITHEGGALKANGQIREYVNRDLMRNVPEEKITSDSVNLSQSHPRIIIKSYIPSEREIMSVLAKTNKHCKEDELNCGACGYSTCREKAIAVLNGQADLEMCIPYMRTRAESMSFEIIQNSPNGIVVMDSDLKVTVINDKARKLLGVTVADIRGQFAYDCFDADEYIIAGNSGKGFHSKKIKIQATDSYAELSVIILPEHKMMFGVYKDITRKVEYDKDVADIRAKTIETTDEVIKKQMRVAQEIASLLGETTAETKVALLKLKKTLLSDKSDDDGE